MGETNHQFENGRAPGSEAKPQSTASRLLLFLVVLFALATIALSVVLAVTVLRVKDNDKDSSGTVQQQQQATQAAPTCPPTEPPTHHEEPEKEVCLTEGCVLAAARVRNAIDPTVEPCDDFYQFACGSWLKTHVIPEDKSSYGAFTQLRDDVSIKMKEVLEEENDDSDPEVIKKARHYYQGCIDEETIEKLGTDFMLDYMEQLGGWPIMGTHKGGNWDVSKYNLEELMILVRNETNTLPLADIYVSQDDKNPTKHILALDQTSLGMPSRDYYLKERNNSMLMAYQKSRAEIAIAFGADRNTAIQDAEDMVDFEIDLANITVRREDRRDPEKLYNKKTVGELTTEFPGIDWVKLAKGTFSHINMAINETEPIIVVSPAYFKELKAVLDKYPKRTIANFIVGNRIYGKTFYLPAVFTDIKLEYQKALTGSATRSPRWQSCGDNIVSAMPQVAGRLFVEKYFKQAAKADVMVLIENLRESFKEMITDLDWMEDKTKEYARDKADYIEPRIGYPEWIYGGTRLEDKYELVTVYPGDPLKSLISFNKAGVQRNLNKLRQDYDKTEWGMSPAAVNAYYSPSSNQITFPAAILQPPFYTKDQPSYLNYGGIGYVIGHEITHGFDDQGRVYDKMGNLHSWWTDVDAKKFKKKAQCIINQYGSYVVPGTGNMTLNGINTQGENIADNGGMKESFKAYRKWVVANGKEEPKLPGLSYTSNQLFFLNAAQMFCEHVRPQQKIVRIYSHPHSIEYTRVAGSETKPKRRVEWLLLILVVLFASLTVILALTIAVVALELKGDHQDGLKEVPQHMTEAVPIHDDICLTEGCVLAAARVRNALDTTVNPCDDFYQFACGGWIKQHVIPEGECSIQVFTKLKHDVSVKLKEVLEEVDQDSDLDIIKKAKDYYKGCINKDRIEGLGTDFILNYMENLGGWPILGTKRGGRWNQTDYNLEDLLILIRNETNTLPLADIYVGKDIKNKPKHILVLDQTSLGMPTRYYYLTARNNSRLMAYQKMQTDIAVALGADRQTAEQDSKDMVDFEVDLAKIIVRGVDKRSPERKTVGQLQREFPLLDWVKLVKGMFSYIKMNISETEPIGIMSPSYFEKLHGVLNKYPPRVIANYLVGRRIYGMTYYLPAVFTQFKLKYQKALTGSDTLTPRWKSCASTVAKAMPQVVGRMFVDKFFKKDAKKDVTLMIENLRNSIKEMITDVDWMEDETKTFARNKADYVEPRIGYPEWIYDDIKLGEKYETVTVYPDDPLRSYISFSRAGVQVNLKKLRQDFDTTRWSMSPVKVNGYYRHSTNQITFPAAIMQPPFYSKDQPAYLNYGGIGYVIGHEFTHGFVDRGQLYDELGNRHSWWSNEDKEKFKNKTQCIIDQYGSYVVPGTGNMTLNGTKTLKENIADNGGMKESFKAYRKWVVANGKEEPKLPGLSYNSNQLFFINSAQIWCSIFTKPAKKLRIKMDSYSLAMFRANGPLQNNIDFAKAFQCPAGSNMNPVNKCNVW